MAENALSWTGAFTVNDDIRDNRNDPFIVKKNELAKKLLKNMVCRSSC